MSQGKKALEKEWEEALAAAETGDPLIASASNTNAKQQKQMAGHLPPEEYAKLIEAARSGKKKK